MATEQSDSSGQVPTWLALLLRQMKEDTNTQLAVIQEWSDAQLAALQVQNGNLIAALSPRMLSTPQVQPAATVNVDNANLMLTKELKASDIGSFKLLNLADASNMQLFINEIDDAVKHYSKDRVIPALHKCLGNDLAHQWFTSLSFDEKTSMRNSSSNFKTMLRHCYMGSSSDLRLLADKEMFNWNQDQMPMEYLLVKMQKLRMAGCMDNNELVAHVWEGLRDAPCLFLTMADKKNSSLAIFRQYLQDVQEVKSEEHQKCNHLKRKASKQRRAPAERDNDRWEHKPYLAKTDDLDSKPLKPCWHCVEHGIPEKDLIHWARKCPNLHLPVIKKEKTTKPKGYAGNAIDKGSTSEDKPSEDDLEQRGYFTTKTFACC